MFAVIKEITRYSDNIVFEYELIIDRVVPTLEEIRSGEKFFKINEKK